MEEMNNKPSYEELEQKVEGFKGMCSQLYDQLQKINTENAFKRLDYLFKVISTRDVFPKEFISTCVSEIMEAMIIPEETAEKEA